MCTYLLNGFLNKLSQHYLRKSISVFCFLIIFSVDLLPGLQATAQQIPATSPADLQAEAARGGYRLIDMNELWQFYRQGDNNLLLVDTRQDWEYHSGHIKNAVNFPMEPTWLSRLTQRGSLEQFLGPDKSKIIVFY